MNLPSDPPVRTDTSTNGDIIHMSPYDAIGADITVNLPDIDILIVRARCCRDWPVLALTKMGHCGYCGKIPVVIGPW